MKSTKTNKEIIEEQHLKQMEQFYGVDSAAVEELTKAVADKKPERVQKRSGTARSSWGSKL